MKTVVDLLALTDCLQHKRGQLSGGERQRVAKGRAMIREPKVFVYDEPLSNLGAKLRVQMHAEIRFSDGQSLPVNRSSPMFARRSMSSRAKS